MVEGVVVVVVVVVVEVELFDSIAVVAFAVVFVVVVVDSLVAKPPSCTGMRVRAYLHNRKVANTGVGKCPSMVDNSSE